MNIRKFLREHSYIWMASYILIYLAWYFIIEHAITDNYWVSYMPLDDKIPFVEWFVIPYCLWYPLLFLPAAVTIIAEPEKFKRYCWYIIIGLSVSLLICTVFPNGQDLRPAAFERDNICTRLIAGIYRADTNTNVLPSMHVVGCIGAVSAVFDSSRLKRLRAPAAVLAVLICAATVFIKQHSILDVFAGLAVSLPVWLGTYGRALSGRRAGNEEKNKKAAPRPSH